MRRKLTVLGIETSCDDTCAAVVERGPAGVKILSNIVWGQGELHSPFGGVVPELAARAHAEKVDLAVGAALEGAPDFVQKVTSLMMAGKGDLLPVSAMPVDGTFPTATAKWEKRSIAPEIPIWDADVCIQCGLCSFVCPHAAIRMKAFETESSCFASTATSCAACGPSSRPLERTKKAPSGCS